MKISSYGHACFKIKCKDLTLLIDPYDNTIGLKTLKAKADVVLTTHNHRDHNHVIVAGKEALVIDGPGEYEVKGTFIYGKEAFHDNKNGEERGVITMYLIEDEKVRIAHLGDLGQKQLTKDQLEFLDNVDVLLIPIGGEYTINGSEATNIINEIEPRIVIPMHYHVPGLKLTKTLEKVDTFIKEIGLNPENLEELKVSHDNLPSSELRLVTLKQQ
jgi:L-ascorbate metabolism protein UlaG (beta-lactamase superfamily)